MKRYSIAIAGVVAIAGLAGCGRDKPAQSKAGEQAPEIQEADRTAATTQPPVPPLTAQSGAPGGREARTKWKGDLDAIAKRRILRVLVVPGKLSFYFNGAKMQGAIYEFVSEFEGFLNKKLNTGNLPIHCAYIVVSRDRLLPMLEDGQGDLVGALLGVSEQREKLVDFSKPIYDKAKEIIVTGPSAPPVTRLEDLSGKTVYYYEDRIPFAKLTELSRKFVAEGRAPIELIPADPNLMDDDLLEMVSAGLVPMTIVEDKLAQFWARVFPGIRPHPEMVVAEGAIAWAMQKNTPKLRAIVDEFVERHRVGTVYGNTIRGKYLNDIKWVKDATSRQDLKRFQDLTRFFRQYGDKYNLPYLLLAAQGYQESGLNPRLKSSSGAVGVMQIKPSTAAAEPISITGINKSDRNIEAGAKYLRYMVSEYYSQEPMDRVTKGLFALASYNAGPNRILKLRKQAAAEGYDPNRWFNHVEVVASREIGRETVEYVANIYKYYLAYKMVTEGEEKRTKAAAQAKGSVALAK